MERTTGNGHHQASPAGFPPELAESLANARDQFSDLNRKALDFVQKRPIPVLIGAFCLGILLGRMASRR
jgi:hypothetical protein